MTYRLLFTASSKLSILNYEISMNLITRTNGNNTYFNVHIAEHLQHKQRFDYVTTDYIFDKFLNTKYVLIRSFYVFEYNQIVQLDESFSYANCKLYAPLKVNKIICFAKNITFAKFAKVIKTR